MTFNYIDYKLSSTGDIMDYEIIFTSKRIFFVKLSKSLINDYLTMVNDNEVQKYISYQKRTFSLNEEIEWIDNKLKEKAIIFSMLEKKTNDFIGNIEIMNIKDNRGELGIAITPNKQNQHFGQEAIIKIIDYAFNTLNLNEIELNVFNYNHRGIKCYEKVGFVIDGQGKTKDDIHMVIKRENYEV